MQSIKPYVVRFQIVLGTSFFKNLSLSVGSSGEGMLRFLTLRGEKVRLEGKSFLLAQCSGTVLISSELIMIGVVISFLDVLSDFMILMLETTILGYEQYINKSKARSSIERPSEHINIYFHFAFSVYSV